MKARYFSNAKYFHELMSVKGNEIQKIKNFYMILEYIYTRLNETIFSYSKMIPHTKPDFNLIIEWACQANI